MPRPRDLFVRTALSLLALGGFAFFLSTAPSARGERLAQKAKSGTPTSEPPAPNPHSGAFTFNGIPMVSEETPVPACDAHTWNPLTAGYCAGHCTPLGEQRTAQGATFGWRDEGTGSVHSLAFTCPFPGATGQASHFSFAGPELTANAAGWTPPNAGPVKPRTAPVPGLPGAIELVHLESGSLTLFVDRPSSAGTALEELHLALSPLGWRVAGGPALRLPEDAPPTRVFVRGAEVYIATLKAPDDDSPPLLVSAYSRQGWALEPPR